jgi:hypothetical protein
MDNKILTPWQDKQDQAPDTTRIHNATMDNALNPYSRGSLLPSRKSIWQLELINPYLRDYKQKQTLEGIACHLKKLPEVLVLKN